jgi:hypothetical protein
MPPVGLFHSAIVLFKMLYDRRSNSGGKAINATVIDGSYPAVSFPKFLYCNILLHGLQIFLCKFSYKKATPCYADARGLLCIVRASILTS